MTNEECLISVIVPVYNAEKYLDECVESIVNQTYKNLEIILVDDGSPDNSPQMCDKWAEKDRRIKVIHKKNGGVSSARNAALEIAQGDYIGFVDSDDFIDEDMFALLINNAVNSCADISGCSFRYFIDGKFTDSNEANGEVKVYESNAMDLWNTVGIGSDVLWNKIYRKSLISDIKFDETVVQGEDVIFNYNAYKKVDKVICDAVEKYSYRMYDNHLTTKPDFHYQGYMAMKKIVSDPECPNAMYLRFFNFATWTLRDIVLDDFKSDFNEIRKYILENKESIKSILEDKGENKKLFKLKVLSFSPVLYRLMLKTLNKVL